MSERKRWVIYSDPMVSGFSAVEISERHRCDFDDPTTYPIATALPLVFDNHRDALRCVAWLEQLVGRLAMAGKIAPTAVNNYYPSTSSDDIARRVRAEIAAMGSRR